MAAKRDKKTGKFPTNSASKARSNFVIVPNTNVWEIQPDESLPAFEAWQAFVDIKDKGEGGLKEVAQRLKKSMAMIGRWSSRWLWTDRYKAYQSYQDLLKQNERRIALRKEAEVWAKRRVSIREKGFGVGENLIKRAEDLLKLPVFEKEVKGTVIDQNGNLVETVTILNFQQHPRDARLFAETGIRLMRLSADLSTENLGNPIEDDIDWDNMTDEQIDEMAEKLKAARELDLKNGSV